MCCSQPSEVQSHFRVFVLIKRLLASNRIHVSRRCRRNRVQAEDNGRKSFGKPRGQAGNCAPRGLTENAPVERFHSPIAGGLQPAGKGRDPSPAAVIRPRLPGAGALRACPGAGRRGRIYRRRRKRIPGPRAWAWHLRAIGPCDPPPKGRVPGPLAAPIVNPRLIRPKYPSKIKGRPRVPQWAVPAALPVGPVPPD